MKTQTQVLIVILIIALSCFFQHAKAQSPTIQWQNTIGGSGDDGGGILKTSDGSFYAFGSTTSSDGDFTFNRGGYDAFLAKYDATGNVIWQKTFGGTGDDAFQDMIEVSTGFVVAGYTSSNDNDVSGNKGGVDGWVVKLTFDGNIVSQHCYGGSGDDYLYAVSRGNGSSYLCSGWSNSDDGDVSGNHGGDDGWVLKLNHSFDIKWSKLIGGENADDLASGVLKTDDGKIVAVGRTESSIGGKNHGSIDVFLVKMNQQGKTIFRKCYGGDSIETSDKVVETTDKNLLFSGIANSNNGDVTDQHGNGDSWIGKVDPSNGNLIWAKCYGNDSVEVALSLIALSDGGAIAVGAKGPDLDWSHADALAFKIDKDGNEIWSTTFGGSDIDMVALYATAVYENENGSITLACYTGSTNGDVTDQHGEGDLWLVNLNDNSERISSSFETASVSDLKNYPNPFATSTTISFSLPQSENVSLKIYDLQGRLIRTLADESMSEGSHTLTWDAHDENGNEVTAGIYFLRIKTEGEVKTITLSVAK